jgi:acetyl esterase/lipase
MSASFLMLVLGGVAALGVLNARRPARNVVLVGASWLAAWATVELAPHLLFLSTVLAGVLIAEGALEETTGAVGLALLAAADAAAVPLMLRALGTRHDLDEITAGLAPSEPDSPYPRSHIALPFLAWRRRGVTVRRRVPFAPDVSRKLRLDVYSPSGDARFRGDTAEGLRPAIIEVHGGAWITGSRHEQGVPLLSHLAANGWVGFNADYRLGPRARWPTQIADVKRAIAWVRANAEEYRVDPSFIAITGGSAGGHLSALAALTAGDRDFQPGFEDADTSVAACIPFYGVYDLLDSDSIHVPALRHLLEYAVFRARRRRVPDRYRDASPVHRVHPGAPPFFVVHGEADSLVPVDDARRFVARLRDQSRAPVLYAEMRGGQHAFDLIPSWRTIPVLDAVERFLADVRARDTAAAGSDGEIALRRQPAGRR